MRGKLIRANAFSQGARIPRDGDATHMRQRQTPEAAAPAPRFRLEPRADRRSPPIFDPKCPSQSLHTEALSAPSFAHKSYRGAPLHLAEE